ncbi:DUF4401 domain-containing protein [Sphingobacterium sp. MYb388]|uniref:DUF4401 domain-containing protein n=1 Tax=Sphingobacterium sp. MYb388 TaxID=2745437 RepID=UPI0030B29DAC
MKNKQEILNKIELLSKGNEPNFQININDTMAAYQHLEENRSNLTIKILSILGVILSVLSFLGALFLLNILNDKLNLIICGSIFLILSLYCIKKYNAIIIDTASIAFYIVGGWMLIYGFDIHDLNYIFILCFIISLCTLLIVQRYLLSLLNILCIIYSIIALINHNDQNLLFITLINAILIIALIYFLSHEAAVLSKRNLISTIYNPLRLGLILATVVTTAFIILSHYETNEQVNNTSFALHILSVLYALATLWVVYKITSKFEITKSKVLFPTYALLILMLGSTVINPGIACSILLILICFNYQYRIGLSIGLISLLLSLWHFYYNLNFSLLVKSLILIISGLLFLAIYFVINSNKINNEKI